MPRLFELGVLWSLMIVRGILQGPSLRQPDEEEVRLRCTERAKERYGVNAVRIGGDIEPPEKLVDAAPDFPELPAGTTVSGGMWLGEVLVGDDGLVMDTWAVRELKTKPPFDEFNESILEAIRKWEYEPIVVGDEPHPSVWLSPYMSLFHEYPWSSRLQEAYDIGIEQTNGGPRSMTPFASHLESSADQKRVHRDVRKSVTTPDYPSTHYLNVDLDVWSRRSLQPMVAAMGPMVSVLYVGRERSRYGAHVEFTSFAFRKSADAAILGLVGVVRSLPPSARRLWDTASIREFNIGIEAGLQPHGFEVHLKAKTVAAVTEIGATIAITVYAPQVDEDERPLPADPIPPGARVPSAGGRAMSRGRAVMKGRRTSGSSGRGLSFRGSSKSK